MHANNGCCATATQIEDTGDVSRAEEDGDAFEDDQESPYSSAAQAAAFAALDPETRRLVLESIAGGMSDADDEEDDESAALAAALMAEAERLEQRKQLASVEHATAEQVGIVRWDGGQAGEEGSAAAGGIRGHSDSDCITSSGSSSSSGIKAPEAHPEDPVTSSTAARSQPDAMSLSEEPSDMSCERDAAETAAGGPDPFRLSEQDPDELLDAEEPEPVDWAQRDPDAVAACVSASGDWSRIVR